ncbi:MAG: SGNH/GDSL hydrolase family protein [Gemmatimonadota bacterium]
MPSRREFISVSAVAMAATRWSIPRLEARGTVKTILFQGDSITDAGRNRAKTGANDIAGLGNGYPLLLAAELRERNPAADLQVLNRGISGHRVPDLAARWQADTIALAPDLLSILIGVNDIWHTRNKNYDGTPAKYESGYNELLANTRSALPQIRLVVMEPFVLRVGAVDDTWFPEFDHYRAAAKRVAKSAGATFVPLHDYLTDLAKKSGPAYWAADGVHPTLAGHQAIAAQWMRVVKMG